MVGMINFLRLMQLLARALRTAWTFANWTVRVCAYMVGQLMMALFVFWRGVPQAAAAIAEDWYDRAYDAGVSTTQLPLLHDIFWCAAFAMFILGWVALSYLTVTFLRLVF